MVCCALSVTGALTPSAHSQTATPPCPNTDDAVTTYAPTYVRRGGSFGVTLERRSARAVKAVELTVTASPPSRSTTEVFDFGNKDRLRLIRAVPTMRKAIAIRIRWQQNQGTPAACVGQDSYPRVPVVPRAASVGDPAVARLQGRWHVRYGERPPVERARWRLTPACDFFGCPTRLRSSRGLSGRLRPINRGRYRLRTRERYATCEITYGNGTKDNYAIYRYLILTLRPTHQRAGRATELTGIRTARYETPSDVLGVCNTPGRERQRVRASKP